MSKTPTVRWLAIACLAALSGAVGCEGIKHLFTSAVPVHEGSQQNLDPHIYPADLPLGQALTLEVVRTDRKHIRINNRTAVPYTVVQVWLNEQYGTTLEELPIGDSSPIPLIRFVNQHGEQFPVGSFLEPDKTRVVATAAIVVEGRLHPIGIQLQKDWRYR
jgi:hypothetical protein